MQILCEGEPLLENAVMASRVFSMQAFGVENKAENEAKMSETRSLSSGEILLRFRGWKPLKKTL